MCRDILYVHGHVCVILHTLIIYTRYMCTPHTLHVCGTHRYTTHTQFVYTRMCMYVQHTVYIYCVCICL